MGTTGIEPVTPTMSTQRADGNCSEISANCPSDVRERSRSDHGNLGPFLGATGDVERDDGSYQLGLDDDAPGPFESRQNEHRSTSQRLELAHPPKGPLSVENAICPAGLPEQQCALAAPAPSKLLSEAESRQLELTIFPRSAAGKVERDGRSRAETIRILVESVDRRGRSSASLPDGTMLVGSSRQPSLDAARVLIAAGYDPASWVEGWRSGASAFALRARLQIAAGLTVDETRTVFAAWKPFFPSAVCSSIRHSQVAATTLALAPSALQQAPPEQQSKKRTETTELGAAPFVTRAFAQAVAVREGAIMRLPPETRNPTTGRMVGQIAQSTLFRATHPHRKAA